MKKLKIGLRFWLAITSLLSFVGGWALFSHAGKPVSIFATQSTSSEVAPAPLPTLAPVPSLDQLVNNNGTSSVQQLPSMPAFSSQQFFPRLRTRGS